MDRRHFGKYKCFLLNSYRANPCRVRMPLTVRNIITKQRLHFLKVVICQSNIDAFFSVPLLSVLRDYSFFFIPATTVNDLRLRRISVPDFTHYIIFLS